MAELLFEIGTEELPSTFLYQLVAQLRENLYSALKDARLDFDELEAFGTPRRLVGVARGMVNKQKDVVKKIRGPRAAVAFGPQGEPAAALGFAKSKGVSVEELVVEEDDKGVKYVYAYKHIKGKDAIEVLPDVLLNVLNSFKLPKSMRWNGKTRFLRPVRWIVAILDGEVVPFSFGGCKSGRTTRGHRFMGKESVDIADLSDYFEKMKENFVIIDPEERKEIILKEMHEVSDALSFEIEIDEELLVENVSLVEYPAVIVGRFDEDFLVLPEEVLRTVMKHHQRYFPVKSAEGKILPYFVAVSNNKPKSMELIRQGNEHVIKARLKDAVFFWEEDLKKSLESRVDALRNIVFEEGLGSMYDKVERLMNLSSILARELGKTEKLDIVKRIAYLCKADLVTSMVYEFPELHGVMGREYALRDGEKKEVANGIFEHILPKFAGDILPESIEGAIVGVCDRIDTIVGAAKENMMPTGSQDPYALRRAARGMMDIIWNKRMDFALMKLVERALDMIDGGIECKEKVADFVAQRLIARLKEMEFDHDIIEAVMAGGWDNIFRTLERVKALSKVKAEDWLEALSTVAGRVKNILKGAKESGNRVDRTFFRESTEIELYDIFLSVNDRVNILLKDVKYEEMLKELRKMVDPINKFFDRVLVMEKDEDIRKNRLALLHAINSLFITIGDISKVVPGR